MNDSRRDLLFAVWLEMESLGEDGERGEDENALDCLGQQNLRQSALESSQCA